MTGTWQLQEAKNKLSEVVDRAINDGPQIITRRGEKAVVVLSLADYQKLAAKQQKLSAFFRDSPLAGLDLDLQRDSSLSRPDLAL